MKRGKLLAKYGIRFPLMGQSEARFWALPGRERMVLIAAYLCDVVKVREVKPNEGFWVNRILARTGLGPGYAWCAAFISFCADLAEYDIGPKKGRAAVRNWFDWAKKDNRVGFKPRRGDLYGWVNPDGRGHIGIATNIVGGKVLGIEGNTNAQGSREGDGAYRKERPVAEVDWIRL